MMEPQDKYREVESALEKFWGEEDLLVGKGKSTPAQIALRFRNAMVLLAAILFLLSFASNRYPILRAVGYLFGAIAAQGIAIMIEKKVDMFSSKNIAVIASIMVIGIGGNYAFGGNIPFFGLQVPCIAGAAIFGILLNLLLSIGEKRKKNSDTNATAEIAEEATQPQAAAKADME